MSFSYKTFSCVISATLKGLLWGIWLVGLSSNTGHKNACVEVFLKLYLQFSLFQFNKRRADISCENFSTDTIIISSPWKESKLFFGKRNVKLIILRLGTMLRRKWQPTSVFLPGKVHGQRSLVGCSPWVYMTEHACVGVEGDGLVVINWEH